MGSSPKGVGSSPTPAIFILEPDEFTYYIYNFFKMTIISIKEGVV